MHDSFNVATLNFPGYNPDFPLFFFVLSLRWQSVALLLSPSSVTMSSLDTATPFVYPSSTLFHAQLSLLNLLVTPQQKLVKSTCFFLRKQLSPTLRASDSTFVKRLLILNPTSFLSLSTTSSPLIFTLKIPRPSGNSKILFSIAAPHTLCHRVPKAVGISFSSDLSTSLAIQAYLLVSTNLLLNSSFHQVLLICLLPKPDNTRPIYSMTPQ